jgi:hypothetical protein
MAVAHEIQCPRSECQFRFSTKANRGIVVNCQGCGEKFRAPEVASADPKAAAAAGPVPPAPGHEPSSTPPAVPPAPVVSGSPPASPPQTPQGSVRVVKAGKVTIKQAARPKGAQAKSAGNQGTTPAKEEGAPTPSSRQVPPPPPNQERSKIAGARGGRGVYARHRGRNA